MNICSFVFFFMYRLKRTLDNCCYTRRVSTSKFPPRLGCTYFVVDKPENNNSDVVDITEDNNSLEREEIDLMSMIKQNIYEEKLRHQEYVNELKHHIEFLKGEIVTKNEIISLLITKISNPLLHEYHIETIPPVPNVINKSKSHLTQNNYPPVKTINHTTNVTGNKTESASIDMNIDKNVTVEIIGDSILNGLVDRGLSKNGNIKTRKYPGCTTRDLKHPRYTYN